MHSLRSSFPSLPSLPVFFSLIVISHYFCLRLFHFSLQKDQQIYICVCIYVYIYTSSPYSQHSSFFHLTIYSIVRVQRYNRGIKKNGYDMQAFIPLFIPFHSSFIFSTGPQCLLYSYILICSTSLLLMNILHTFAIMNQLAMNSFLYMSFDSLCHCIFGIEFQEGIIGSKTKEYVIFKIWPNFSVKIVTILDSSSLYESAYFPKACYQILIFWSI